MTTDEPTRPLTRMELLYKQRLTSLKWGMFFVLACLALLAFSAYYNFKSLRLEDELKYGADYHKNLVECFNKGGTTVKVISDASLQCVKLTLVP